MKDKIRIAVVSESMKVGGGEMIAAKLASYIDSERFEVKFFVIARELNNQIRDYLVNNNVNFECLNLPTSFRFNAYKQFSSRLSEFSPDIVHEHLDSSYSWIWSLLHRVPLIATIHTDPFRRRKLKVNLLIKFCELFGQIKIVCCSKKTEQLSLQCYKLRKENITHIYNPIDSSMFLQCNQDTDNIQFVHVGRFHEVKNHRALIEAFSVFSKSYPNCNLTLAGDGPLLDSIKTYVNELELTERVSFLGNVTNIPELLSKMNVFVLPSKSEACPVVILEAMASGLPIIASEVGGIPELVTDNGILVAPNDVSALAEAMKTLAGSQRTRKEMSVASLRNIKQFDKDHISKEYEGIYRSMTKRKLENESN